MAVMMAIGAAFSAVSSIQQGRAANAMHRYNAQLMEQNAQFREEKARYDADKQQRRLRRALGKQRAGYGASGVVSDTGSALDVRMNDVIEGEIDRLTIMYEGAIEAADYRGRGRLEIMKGKSKQKAGYMSALSTGFKAGGQYYKSTQGDALKVQ